MTRVYYKEAVGAIIVFDVTRVSTFDAVQKWKADIDSKVSTPTVWGALLQLRFFVWFLTTDVGFSSKWNDNSSYFGRKQSWSTMSPIRMINIYHSVI